MTQIKTSYNRRSFLQVSSAAGGGLILGFSFLTGCKSDVIEEEIAKLVMPEQWFNMNAFIKVGDNGVVTILSPNPEIGQNVKTSMPMLIAEELDVDWENVVVEQAPLDTDKYQRQVAGGSQSIRHGWTSLRTAGATVRRMLMDAAANKLEVSADELTTENGIIHHKTSGQSIGYGKVASDAAAMEVPEEVTLKDPKDFKIIGQSILNVDGRGIVTGAPLFGMDYKEDGMLIAMVQHAPSFGSKLKSFNKEEIKAMPGISDAFELDIDFIGDDKWYSKAFKMKSMVAVVGQSTWQVMNAKKAIKAEWERYSDAESSSDHDEKLSAFLDGNQESQRKDGDPDKAFDSAAKVIERTYTAPFLPHNTMSPMNFFADVKSDSARLVGPIQTPAIAEGIISEALSIPKENVTVEMTRMGGGFGRRLYGNFVFESAMISQKVGKPIKLIYSREDDMGYGTYRPAYKVKYKAALDENNNLIAFTVNGAGTHGGPVFKDRFPAGSVANYSAADSAMDSNISTGAWRAPKSNFIAGAEQSFIDEVAELAGKDPIDFRLELFENAKNNPVGEENDYDAERYAGVLKMVKEKSGWGTESKDVHRGVSAYYCHNSYVAQVIDIVKKDGKPVIDKVWSAVDCGIVVNPTGAKNQVEGGAIDGIGTAMYGGIGFKNGVPDKNNFAAYQLIRHADAPKSMETFFVDNGIDPTGLGEPGMPPVIGALANALYKATGKRFYDQPFAAQEGLLG